MRLTRFQYLVVIFCLINLAIFIKLNNVPIRWQQGEITFHNLYWASVWPSTDGFILKSGLRLSDFFKVFLVSEEIEGHFRPRHFSYLIEMLSFKFWQTFSVVTFRNYSLIFLHGLNVLLSFLVASRLTKSRRVGLIAALLFMNAGVSFATLLYPFRNAKLLVTSIFLFSWLLLIKRKQDARKYFSDLPIYLLFFLGFFTDELFLFLLPILLIYWIYFPPRQSWRPIARNLFLTLGLVGIFLIIIYYFDSNVGRDTALPYMSNYIEVYVKQFSQWQCVRDFMQALGAYFLRRNFGYWDFTLLGVLACICFCGLIYLICRYKVNRELRLMALILLAGILLQGLFCLREGMHKYIFPPHARFFTILFFSYYYTYTAVMLISCTGAILLARSILKDKVFMVVLLLVSVISLSNLTHAQQNILGPLRFHRQKYVSQRVAPKVLRIKEAFRFTGQEPIYMSFPSGSQAVFNRKLGGVMRQCIADPKLCTQGLIYDCFDYAAMIPVLFLRRIEEGRMIISLHNVADMPRTEGANELLQASFFLDAVSATLIDLRDLIEDPKLEEVLTTRGVDPINKRVPISHPVASQHFVFFVKGQAQGKIKTDSDVHEVKQLYGYSYQMFLFKTDELLHKGDTAIEISFKALDNESQVSLIGPYFIQ